MLKQAKLKLQDLLYNDSGVALAYTLVVFLFFFMLCVSCYATAENIRQKIELQNACDAAAYSGAVVQADMLSRIAILNRALSWTYAETNKRHMDSIVHDWLTRAVAQYDTMRNWAENGNRLGSFLTALLGITDNGKECRCPIGQHAIGWFAGTPDGTDKLKEATIKDYVARLRLNGTQDVEVATIRETNSAYTRNNVQIGNQISNGYSNIDVLNREISLLRANMNIYIGRAINYSMQSMIPSITGFRYFLDGSWENTGAASYILPQTNENTFLNYSNSTREGDLNTGSAAGQWWVLSRSNTSWWDRTDNDGDDIADNTDGFQRNYRQGRALRAEMSAFYTTHSHWHTPEEHACSGKTHYRLDGNTTVSIDGRQLIDVTPARPAMLDRRFFGQPGSIVVAANRPMVNPFTVIMGANASAGLYGAFNNSTGWDMWVVSTARAGVRLAGDAAGHYRVLHPPRTYSNARYTNNVWNLCEEDWDAVMIPVSRAWHDASTGAWAGEASSTDLIDGFTDAAGNNFPGVRNALGVNTRYSSGMGTHIRH